MSLADRLATSTETYSKNTECQTCRFITGLDQRDRQEFDAWIAAGYNLAELYRHCRDEGLNITHRNFAAHFEKSHDPR